MERQALMRALEAAEARIRRATDAAAEQALFREALASADAAIRLRAVGCLFRLQDVWAQGAPKPAWAVAELCRVLAGDPDDFVRRDAALALGKIGDAAAVPALIEALGDEDYDCRENSLCALVALAGDEAPLPADASDPVDAAARAGILAWWAAKR